MTTEEAVGRIAGSGGRRQWPETHEMKCGAGGGLGVAVRGKGLAGGALRTHRGSVKAELRR